MADFMKSTNPQVPVIFNVGKAVGQGGVNDAEDVALASYLMRLSAKAAKSPEARKVCAATKVTSTCTPEFVASIKALQNSLKLSPDGRISRSSQSGQYGNGVYLIASFNKLVRDGYPDLWPRIDRIPDVPSPGQITSLVKRGIIGI
ncbi:hypothetical protein GCM10011371_01610 [Novosphingobium marinum]|uniref:Uncharacterized protein n=1 Tax=Novosphingobium marinum TaxID=1514948 RepID=A0A7Y9XVD3_9SPHN|nr:hypothetical protein [Novosphingobium marinum]NYH93853.1 hypothetical protein [Novosphingobium marinum]GGC17779.1 hypothetical protein GCM10011371_01610 [Novosphingobium marinum]